MHDLRPYRTILSLPLFQGLGHDDLEEVVAHTKFAFTKHSASSIIIKEGDLCTHMRFILNGTVETETLSDDHGYRIIETIAPPEIIEPERIFGLRQRYSRSFMAKTNCNMMSIDKIEIMNLADRYPIFRINLLNIYSTKAQKAQQELWRSSPSTLRQHIIRFLERHCERPAGEKIFFIKMNRLAEELNDSRRDISGELNKMQKDGLIILKRGRIIIPQMEQVIRNS
nr:Crp/Fnr family transcriptional regulator [Prevotella sp.]